MSNEPLADPARFELVQSLERAEPWVDSKLTSQSHPSISSNKADIWWQQKASNSACILATDTPSALSCSNCHNQSTCQSQIFLLNLSIVTEQTILIYPMLDIWSEHANSCKLQESYCKSMSADFTKGTVSCYQELVVTKFETNFKDQQTVKNRTIKVLKAEQSPDFQHRGHKQSQ